MTILTDEEITLIVRECARGSAINRDGSTSHRIARAIESTVLAKLREQSPVAFYDGNKFYANEESGSMCCADMRKLKPVFLHPAPIPEGWQPIETAPKDGTEVILWFPHLNIAINGLYGEVSDGDWESGFRHWKEWLVADELWFQEDPSEAPTHWMPLPPAIREMPKEKQNAE